MKRIFPVYILALITVVLGIVMISSGIAGEGKRRTMTVEIIRNGSSRWRSNIRG